MTSTMSSLEAKRHSLAHLLAAAVLELYPDAKRAIGPAIDNGFYYDIKFSEPISNDALPKIEKRMRKIFTTWKKFEGKEVDKETALAAFPNNPFKQELIDEIAEKGEKITLYTSGSYTDLCRGGHADSMSDIDPDSFKLSHVAGAYWRGDEKNPQLTRIYGLAFDAKEELDRYVSMMEEAKKRDHKILGPQLDLFVFSDLIGSGLPLFTPRGTIIRNLLDNFVWQLRKKAGYLQVDIPHITKKDLYEKSGHWDKFKDDLFRLKTREGHEFAIKPMNCPHHTQIYARKQWSYRDLPQRYSNTTKVYRDEQSGELAGLTRVRSITQDDAHVFCRHSQIKNEMFAIWDIVQDFYRAFGLRLLVRISTRDPAHPEKYLGDSTRWDEAEKTLKEIVDTKGNIKYIPGPGEANFYGPKLDFTAQDSMGREWQVATIQLDMSMPERFDLTCVNEKGEKERIVMIHAAIMGSIERFMGVLIEHTGGSFPIWLAPTQVSVLAIGDKQNDYAQQVAEKLEAEGIRTETNVDNDTIGKKIRGAEIMKVPYLLIVGGKEVEADKVAVRQRGKGDLGQMDLGAFIQQLISEIAAKA